MTLLELERLCRGHRLVHELFSVKRCFGPHASIGIADSVWGTDYDTVAKLVEGGHVSTRFLYLDHYLSQVPKVTEVPRETDSYVLEPPPALCSENKPE